MTSGLFALIVIFLVIAGAIITRKVELCLVLGSFACCIYMYQANFMTEWCSSLVEMLAENIGVFLIILAFGALIALLQDARGSYGFSNLAAKYCNNESKTLFTTFLMGILIFADDYLNVLSIGACMKDIYDKRKIPRETLAFMLDATGTPVCVLIPFSTWAIFYANMFFKEDCIKAAGFKSGFDAYVHAIPYCIYPIAVLILVVLFAAGVLPKLGAMKKAYERVAETGKVYSDYSKKYNHESDGEYVEEGKLYDFLIPMLVLIVAAIMLGDMFPAIIISIVVCAVMYIPRKVISLNDFLPIATRGIADMLPVTILTMLAFLNGAIMDKMHLTEYIIDLTKPMLSASFFPVVTFVLISALCFCTASLWGMIAIIIPIIFPLAGILGANPLLIMAAAISGGAFGSHACFYCDATLLSSNSAGIDSMEHAMTQLPYVIIASVISLIFFTVTGFIM